MIGYYIHHVGQGHLYRATAVATALGPLGLPVTGLSSLCRPAGWPGPWRQLPRDDQDGHSGDATAGGTLHWAPLGDAGLRTRMAAVSAWIERARPSAFVSDLSVEMTALARLHGIPVATTVLPGRRDDPAHQLGFHLADVIIAPWPELKPGMCPGLEPYAAKVTHVGGLSRFDAATPGRTGRHPGARQLLALSGAGSEVAGTAPDDFPTSAHAAAAGWRAVRRGTGSWVADLWPDLCAADVVVTHAGLGAISDVAAARKPAIVIPEERPHQEQEHTAAALAAAEMAIVLDHQPGQASEWRAVLGQALELDTRRWARWSSGDGTQRCADLISDLARRRTPC